MVTLPTAVGAPDSAANTVAQAFEGARASALGSSAEGSRPHPSSALVCGYKIADFRRYFGPEARAIEHAIMPDIGLKMVGAFGVGKVCAQYLCSKCLADPRNVILLALHRH
jgi:hypothetical protein